MEKLVCFICEKEINEGDRILAFDEFIPSDYEWEDYKEYGVFEEVDPNSGSWNLAHYFCMFKKS